MIEKETAKEYFNSNDIKRFSTVTPEGNNISGWICRSHNEFLGSLLIDTVNDVETTQFVRATPKFGYFDARYNDLQGVTHIVEKLDGTNILAFPLYNKNGECIEVCHKTRTPRFGTGMMEKTFKDLLDKVWTLTHEKLIRDFGFSMSFELYGLENNHGVNYNKVAALDDGDINLALLMVLNEDGMLPYAYVKHIGEHYNIKYAKEMFDIVPSNNGCFIEPTNDFKYKYHEFMDLELLECVKALKDLPSAMDLLQDNILERINESFNASKFEGIAVEGVVWYTNDLISNRNNAVYKNKAKSVREGHMKAGTGIASLEVRKAVDKANENMNIVDEPLEEVIQFIREELYEENDKEIVDNKKVTQQIMSAIGRKKAQIKYPGVKPEFKDIATDIVNELGTGMLTSDYMRKFGTEYPHLKKHSKEVYAAVIDVLAAEGAS